MKSHALVVCLFFAAFGLSARAQLAVWNVLGTDAATTNPSAATSLGANIASASLTLGSGVSPSGTNDTFGGTGFGSTSLSSAISNADYISFTITPASGYTLSLSSIVVNTGVATAVTNFNGALLSSVTGFTAADALHTYSFSTTGAPTQSITLSSTSSLQNVSGPVEFRLYGWRDPTGTSTFRIRDMSGNDLVINGSANLSAVPEPSTYALIAGCAALGVALWKRRKN